MVKQFIIELVSQMTLEEKAAQLTQLGPGYFLDGVNVTLTGPYRNWNISKEMIENIGSVIGCVDPVSFKKIQKDYLEKNRNKIPLLFMADMIHGMKTIFPIPLALAGSFDLDLVKETARISALESAVSGLHVTFSPMADLTRDPRWGRVMESPGEDPYLNSLMTKAMVEGYQGDDLKDKGSVAACVKHFAAYGAPEGGREYNTVDMSRGVLRDFYLPAYQAAVDAKVAMVMTSFNTVERVPASANKWLLRKLLRKDWGFDGVIISDFNSVDEIINHSIAADVSESAYKCISAGLDIEMMSANYLSSLPELVRTGEIAEDMVNEAVIRVLELKDKLGLFENPYKDADEDEAKRIWLCKEYREVARKSAAMSTVLLKNEGVLPLNNSIKVGIAGPFAKSQNVLGGWSGQGQIEHAVSLEMGIANVIGANQVVTAMTQEVSESLHGFIDVEDKVEEALDSMKDCDVLIAAVGEHPGDSGEGGSKTTIRLSPNQEKLIREMKATGKPVVVILYAGRPIDIESVLDCCDALIHGWFLGTEAGNGLADILYAKVNPSARLTMTMPRNVGQIPIYYNSYNTGRPYYNLEPTDRFSSRYIDCPNSPLYPFGYGLSYSEFKYSDFTVVKEGENVTASVVVTNISNRAGREVVQLYIRDVSAHVVRPLKELKGFEAIYLNPEESSIVSFTITKEMLQYYDECEELLFEPGDFDIMVGPNSEDLRKERIYIK